ncbi:sensor domain-containing protein [Cellulomonas endophytica]|uniref:sensor domain-containing protein n=1 Tax=Cellulomonas endophytica TaxID=2494735 RepID=UPI001011CA3D|nr:sensor domain-containing protein [Cellulomonas endophytica]
MRRGVDAGRDRRLPGAALAAAALVVGLAACAGGDPVGAGPSATGAPGADAPTAPGSTGPSSTGPGSAEPAAGAGGSGAPVPTDLPPDALLPPTAFPASRPGLQEQDEVTAWLLPPACGPAPVPAAAAMRTHRHGDGAEESTVGVQQVALFPDADAATTAADGVVDALDACATTGGGTGGGTTTYRVEEVPVGAQGHGLVTDYHDAGAGGADDGALGSYLVVTRRGTAVTLVAADGGESSIGSARTTVTEQAQSAWTLLCRYEAAGC